MRISRPIDIGNRNSNFISLLY